MFRVTAPEEDYLKGLHMLDPAGAGVRAADLAQALGVSRDKVLRTAARLGKEDLVESFGKNRIGLTDAGRQRARDVKSRYEVIRLYFLEILRVDSKTAAREAGQLGHTLSGVSLAAMKYAVAQSDDWGELARLVSA